MTDGLTGVGRTHTFNDAGQLATVTYGSGGPVRTLAYDPVGRLSEDVVTHGAATRYSASYSYDANSNVTSKTVGPAGTAGAGQHSYSYDFADRLTSWTAPSASATSYAYDPAGNRTQVGAQTFTYDERNRLTAGSGMTYAWSPRGTLASSNDGTNTTNFVFDALGRLTQSGGTTYTYDALDRIATRNGQAFSYGGTEMDPVGDGTFQFSRSPTGRLAGVKKAGSSAGIAINDRHGDLAALLSASGTVTDTATYDPYGALVATTGSTSPTVGYQGDWTDPVTGHVWMGARWYAPTIDNFISRDSLPGLLRSPVSLNRYTYASNNPMTFWDPTGRYTDITEPDIETAMYAAMAAGYTLSDQEAVARAAAFGNFVWTDTPEQVVADWAAQPAPATAPGPTAEEMAQLMTLLVGLSIIGLASVGALQLPSISDDAGWKELFTYGSTSRSGPPDPTPAIPVVLEHPLKNWSPGKLIDGDALISNKKLVAAAQHYGRRCDAGLQAACLTQWAILHGLPLSKAGSVYDYECAGACLYWDAGGVPGDWFFNALLIDVPVGFGVGWAAAGLRIFAARTATNTGGARFVAGSDGVVTDLVGGSPNAVILGKYPAYVNEGAATGARTFSMSDEAWNAMTPAQQWTRNRQFLDEAISRGSEIWLATPPTASNLTGWYAREIEYLIKQGYRIGSDGARMLPPGG